MDTAERQEQGTRRNRSIRLAVVTSFLSKAGTGLLQLLAIPIAVRVMGREEFGIYTSISLALSTVALLEVGIGPALAHGISKAGAEGDGRRRRVLASTSFLLMLGLALATAMGLAAVLLSVPIPTLFGDDFAGREQVMRPALWIGLATFTALFLLNLTDRMREGLLEVAITNVWGAAGNVLAAIAVAGGIWFFPEIWYLVVAIHGSVVIAKVGNTVALWRKYPDLIPRPRSFDAATARHLFGDGLAFASAMLLTGVVEYNFCGWLVGRIEGPGQVALYGPLTALTVMQLGFVMMVSTPTWPAVADALARGDRDWARTASKKLYLYGCCFALAAATGMIVVGPWGFRIWLGEEFGGVERGLLAAYACYFVAHVWRHLNHMLMIGTGQVTRLARIQLIETPVLATAAAVALWQGGMDAMLLAMAASILLVTGWMLPIRVWKLLRE
ncbi:lipopolysaccharide biosynthesis protein [Haloferula sp. A504]|uniref:lipopolysaccharide biosynthesis protein n=1 Tax=Haloferula sp. A504 TaxID=3373601 RepID=UPI0031C21D37|nr:oligosaccharide flippase family protein [Verrucomicrobiaceae bacterium E54]